MRDRSWNGNERNRLLVNFGDGTFVEAATPLGVDSLRDGRGTVVADFDGDGDEDLIVNNYRAAPHYYVNEAANGRWLKVRLRGRRVNRDAVGAVVRARTGPVTRTRVVTAGDGYASQSSRTVRFGLGPAASVDELEIVWPGGRRQVLRNVPAGRILDIEEDAGGPP